MTCQMVGSRHGTRLATARALTTLTAAAELGIERRVLARWGEAGCPHDPGRRGPGGSARWDVAEVREWMEAVGRTREPGRQLGTVLGGRATPADPPPAQPAHGVRADPAGIRSALLAQRLRREVLTRQRIDLDLQQRRGELVPAAWAEAHRLELIHAARAGLLGGPAPGRA